MGVHRLGCYELIRGIAPMSGESEDSAKGGTDARRI